MGLEGRFEPVARVEGVQATEDVASALAPALEPGDVILLEGELGAGKTQFVQGVAAGLGAAEVPSSPTFNIVLTYASGRLDVHHFDLYRLESERDLEDVGLREYLESGGVCFVEWAGKFPGAFDEYLAVKLEKRGENIREITARARGDRAEELLAAWKGGLAGDGPSETTPAPKPSARQDAKVSLPTLPSNGASVAAGADERYVLAFDTSNETVALALGALRAESRCVELVTQRQVLARRASNTQLLPLVDGLMQACGVERRMLACVCVGRGPGSFTGVRIAMATAKGIAQALGVALVGVSTLDAIAWNAQACGLRGTVLVAADAMRKEVYPARYELLDAGCTRLSADRVVKAQELPAEARGADAVIGDALAKYLDLIDGVCEPGPAELWSPTGSGLLAALQDAWRAGDADPLDAHRHDPAHALPVYTRLSDAEEHERAKLADPGPKNLSSGVQGLDSAGRPGRATMHAASVLAARPDGRGIAYRPLDAASAGAVAALEARAMGSDAWNERLVADELGQRNRIWWIAQADGELVGYAGALVVDGDLQVLKVAVEPAWRRAGIARALMRRLFEDGRNLGARTCSLEVRAGNEGAQRFYRALGLEAVGTRPRYYSDREDALIMSGSLEDWGYGVAGMDLKHLDTGGEARQARSRTVERPLVLAIESSCDETAAAVADGAGELLSDVVASQIDFHSRFGGVVPEIASRKHIEAICGVCAEALDVAGWRAGGPVGWKDLDAVAVTYAPGLVGALVVGVAFAKGAAWALDVPFIGVNHLEGHLYANKVDDPGFQPPAVVSLVSGGNTLLVHMRGWGDYETLGSTIDDAVGEAFDKVSKALGLGYPGGPVISKLAAQGDPNAIAFPRALLHSHDFRFSLSGVKTAVVNYIAKERQAGRELNLPDIAASFQQAVVDVQVAKAADALARTGARTLCLGGGVAANPALRQAYETLCAERGVRLVMPPLSSCGDNAGMIALVALDRYRQGKFFGLDADAYAHADLDEPY